MPALAFGGQERAVLEDQLGELGVHQRGQGLLGAAGEAFLEQGGEVLGIDRALQAAHQLLAQLGLGPGGVGRRGRMGTSRRLARGQRVFAELQAGKGKALRDPALDLAAQLGVEVVDRSHLGERGLAPALGGHRVGHVVVAVDADGIRGLVAQAVVAVGDQLLRDRGRNQRAAARAPTPIRISTAAALDRKRPSHCPARVWGKPWGSSAIRGPIVAVPGELVNPWGLRGPSVSGSRS